MKREKGFTLIELLVVMGIILLLIAILLPAVNRAYRNSVRSTMQADLQAISAGLEAYRNDWGIYPTANSTTTGAVALCWALLSPGPASEDGSDGPGFRLRGTQGTVYGPYLNVDRFAASTASSKTAQILDRYGNPILYFPAYKQVPLSKGIVGADPASVPTPTGLKTAPPAFVRGAAAPSARFNWSDNASQGNLSPWAMAYCLGDRNWNCILDGAAISFDDVTFPEVADFPVGGVP